MVETQLAGIVDNTDYQAAFDIIRAHLIGQGRRAQFIADELVIGVKHRVGIRVVAASGKPSVRARTTSHDAVGELLGLLVDLDILIPPRRAALDEIRRALESASLDAGIPKPMRDNIDCADLDCGSDVTDCFDLGDLLSSCDLPACELPSCDLPACDLPCDAGCF